MVFQRNRSVNNDNTVPERNTISPTKFEEGQSPSVLTPISPVTTPGGSVRVDAGPGPRTYIHLVGDEGLTWKHLDTDSRVARVEGQYIAATGGVEETLLIFGAEELFGGNSGNEVVRDAFFESYIIKDPANPSAANDNNQAGIFIVAQIDSSHLPTAIEMFSKNDGRTIRIRADEILHLSGNFTESIVRHLGGPGTLGTTDVNGFLTITHNAGFTPKAVQMIKTNTTGAPDWWMAGTDTYGATTFRARFVDSVGNVVASSSVSGAFICYK